jgi:hypothetical protein
MIQMRSGVFLSRTQTTAFGETAMYNLIIALAFIGVFAAPAVYAVRADTKANRK